MDIRGFAKLRETFAGMALDLRDQAVPVLKKHADAAAARLVTAYPKGPTGNLRAGVTVTERPGKTTSIVYRVRSGAPHAHLYEFGTARGQRPRATFLPITGEERTTATGEIIAIVATAGFLVGGAFGD